MSRAVAIASILACAGCGAFAYDTFGLESARPPAGSGDDTDAGTDAGIDPGTDAGTAAGPDAGSDGGSGSVGTPEPFREFVLWAPGEAHAYVEMSADVIQQTSTGLFWQRKVPTKTLAQEDAESACAALELDANGDWRLPTLAELYSLVDLGQPAAKIAAVFPATPEDDFVSHSNSAATGNAWTVPFGKGALTAVGSRGNSYHYRCVRGGKPKPTSAHYSPGTTSVLDAWTGLTWTKATQVAAGNTATSACNALAGGWKVPTLAQLLTLYDVTRTNPALDGALFDLTDTVQYSATSDGLGRYSCVDFRYPMVYVSQDERSVRCVR